MDTNIAAWMISGGRDFETRSQARERENLVAFRESQREAGRERRGIVDRIRAIARPAPAEADLACCPA